MMDGIFIYKQNYAKNICGQSSLTLIVNSEVLSKQKKQSDRILPYPGPTNKTLQIQPESKLHNVAQSFARRPTK